MRNSPSGFPESGARLSVELIEAMTRSLGTPRFGRQLLDALEAYVRVDHCSVFIRSAQGTLRMLTTASRVQQSNGARAALRYMSEMHCYDGFGGSSAAATSGATTNDLEKGTVRVTYRTRDQISHTAYRLACYEQVGIEDRLSMSRSHQNGTATILNCYRDTRTGRLSAADIEAMAGVASMFLAYAEAHARLSIPHVTPASEWRESLDAMSSAGLSAREREVCASLLSGLTLADTARKLDLSLNTIVTYSRRAHAKLGVNSTRELHTLLIEAGTQATLD
ncbi:LuxR C-terminal-related transcriptional regulator [Cupriavidus sp. TMH.W2]|uniref:helix-turn-helix transcriptional regulator n=1 Tax=Cupriavidus sp. TMH.W2 TaxID=3434465 RepID=UPI003D772DE1